MKIEKYFWDLNKTALRETVNILKRPSHPKFAIRMVTILSRCDRPKELFSMVPKEVFIKSWPTVRSYWVRVMRKSEFRDWWETMYEQLLEKQGIKGRRPKGEASELFKDIGRLIRQERIEKGFSQKELSLLIGIKQPEISKIEEGKKNITMATLARFCKVLGIRRISLK